MAGHVTIEGVNSGLVDLEDILKLNALMDAQAAAEEQASKGSR